MHMLKKGKKVVLISFYDRVSVSTRALSSVLRKAGHRPYLIYFKDDRAVIKDSMDDSSEYYQMIINNKFVGCGEDVNPPVESEFKLLAEKVLEINPEVIAISARSVAKELSKKVTHLLRGVLPNALYIGGGFGPTIDPEAFLEFLDFVCLGEGEQAILDMVLSKNLKQLDNVAWLENGQFRYNKLAKGAVVDELSYPDWDLEDKYLIEDEKVTPMEDAYDVKTYDIFASRGCVSGCTYCMACHWDKMYEKYGGSMPKIRLRSVESVIDELLIAKEKYDLENIRFMDSIFGYNKKWLFEFLDIYDEKIGLKFFCHLDERYIDEERIKRLKASGINFTTVGIQSTNKKIRYEIMNRNVSNDSLVKYAETLVNNGIKLKYDIIGWNPFESNETLREGVDFLKRLPKGERTVVFKLNIFPGSTLSSIYEQKKPKALSNKEYEYWAWIYQMILRSKEAEQIADFVLKYNSFKDNPRILRELLDEAEGKLTKKDKIFAARDIRKGQIVTRVMLDPRETSEKGGIFYDNRHRVLSKVACRDIKKGDMVLLKDFFSAYQKVGGGNF